MANTKNYSIREKVIDELLRRPGGTTRAEMMEACNQRLEELGCSLVNSENTILGDLRTIEEKVLNGHGSPLVSERRGRLIYYRYADINFSLYRLALTADELLTLNKAMEMLSHLQGLPDFGWADEVNARLRSTFFQEGETAPVIAFDNDARYVGARHIRPIYDAILRHEVLLVTYHPFDEEPQHFLFHPYFLKQYRHRWYVFGHRTQGEEPITRLALDRMEKMSIAPGQKYIENHFVDFATYFDDIIGISHIPGNEPQTIRYRVPRYQAPWMDTEPLHPSQQRVEEDGDTVTYQFRAAVNHELMQIMLAYSQYIEVLEPHDLREFFWDIYQEAADRHCDYDDDDWLNDEEEENFNDNADSIN